MVAPTKKATIEMLKDIQLFKVFQDSELQQILAMGTSVSYESFANIIIEGELTWGLYLIMEGTVGIFKANTISGNVYDIGQLTDGSFFGEMSLVDENSRSATVRALTNCQLFYISKESFIQFLHTSSERKNRFYEKCIKDLVERLRELNDGYVISQYQLWKSALKKNNGEEAA